MEAISVAGSVVGIISVTAKLATGLMELIERGKNVPDSVRGLISELNDMRGCLAQLQPFLQDAQRTTTSRTALISLDQIVTINTSCVLTLSELEKFIDSFRSRAPFSHMDRLRWLKNESRIERMLLRIRASRSSLNLILVILTCISIREATTALRVLIPTVEGIRTSSQDMTRRLAALEQTAHHLPINEVGQTSQGNCNEQISEVASRAGSGRAQASRGASSESQDLATFPKSTGIDQALPNDLELLLQCSRPYSRIRPGFQSLALSSASGHTGLDTVTTGMSLSAVSNLSLFSLPISIHEIWNTSHYTAAKDPPLIPPRVECQPHGPSKSKEASSSSGFDQDNESSSTSSETSTSRSPYGLGGSEHVKTVLSGQDLGIQKPRRKIVFHGADESGMSTLIKQMQVAYAPESINATLLEGIRFELWFNLLTAFQIAVAQIAEYHWVYESNEATAAANLLFDGLESSKDVPQWSRQGLNWREASDWPLVAIHIEYLPDPNVLLPYMETLWRDPVFQKILSLGHEYVQYDNIYYYFRYSKPLFLQCRDISVDDFLRARSLTRQNTEKSFETANYVYHVFDVHGGRHARKEWIHTWEGADCIFFVASLAGYNRIIIEDKTANQMIESLLLFESLLAIQKLKTSSIVLILNKLDIFKQQIQEHPLEDWFPDFVGREKDSEAALSYIVAKFKAAKSVYDEREINVYFTDATNVEACQSTLLDIEDTVMPKRFKSGESHRRTACFKISDLRRF